MRNCTSLLSLTIIVIVTQTIQEPAHAQISESKITASDGAANDNFGFSVSISGDYAIVGAPFRFDYHDMYFLYPNIA